MMIKTGKWTVLVLACLLVSGLLPVAAAQQAQNDSSTTGEDNEFGSIRMFATTKVEPGEPTPIQAKVNLRTHYEEQDATYFMFGITGEQTPLEVTLESVRTAQGEIPAYKKDSNGKVAKWFIDIADMPEVGTEIIIEGTVNAPEAGSWQAGAIVVPFTYRWEKIQMSSGIEAKLYGFTQVAAQGEPGEAGFAGKGNKLPVPGFGALLAPAALGAVALGLAANRRRD